MIQPFQIFKKPGLAKQIFSGGAVFILFFLFWLFLSQVFKSLPAGEAGASGEILFFGGITASHILLIIFLSFLAVLAAVFKILSDNFWLVLTSYFLSLASFFVFFPFKFLYFLALCLILLVLIFGYLRLKREKENVIRFRPIKLARLTLSSFLTIFILLLSLIYYFAVVEAVKTSGLQIPKGIFDKTTKQIAQKFLPSLVPGFNEKASVEDVIYLSLLAQMEDTAKNQERLDFPPEIASLLEKEGISPQDKEAVFHALRENPQIKEKTMEYLTIGEKEKPQEDGIEKIITDLGLNLKEPFFEALYKAANQKVEEITKPYLKYFAIIFALLFFVSLKFIFLFLIWPICFLVFALIKILLALKFARLEKVKKEVEVLKL